MSTTTAPSTRNGVDTSALFSTLDAVKAQPELAKFQFRATNTWLLGTHNVSTIDGYYGAGQELGRDGGFRFDADHPPVLTGSDHGPTPVEFLLHALAACLTAGLVNIAAARGVTLTSVSSTVTGDIDLLETVDDAHFLGKPFSPGELLDRVEKLLSEAEEPLLAIGPERSADTLVRNAGASGVSRF